MEESGNDKRVLDLLTKDSHHHGITGLYLTQDLFPPGKFSQTINQNANYAICFKGRYTRGVLLPEHVPGSFCTCQYTQGSVICPGSLLPSI